MDAGAKSVKKVQHKCTLCDAQFKNKKEKTEHKYSPFHKFMVTTKKTQQSYIGNAKTLNEQITESGRKEPLIGLDYIYEYAEDSDGDHMYECKLCDSAFKADIVYFHIVGIQHRVLYLAKHHPIMGIEAGFEVILQAQYKILANSARAIESTHGRKKINVTNEVYESKPDICEVSDSDTDLPPSSGTQRGKSTSSRRDRRARAQEWARARKQARPRARTRQRDRESQRDGVDLPRLPPRDPSQDFDARTLLHDSDPGSQNNSKDDAKGRQDIIGLSAQPRIHGVPPFQYPAAGVPPVGPGLPLTAGVAPTAQDAYDDTDFRRRRSGASAAAGGPKDQNRRQNISPDRRLRGQRPGSRFDVGPGDIDVRSVLPSGGISFRELKTAHLRNIRAGGFSSTYVPLHDRRRKDQEADSNMEVCDMEFSDTEPDDFWCNEELFDFLKSYYIADEEDVYSVLESVKLLSEALVRHKSRKEDLQKRILEERQSLEDEKKKFLAFAKRTEDKITSKSMKSHEPENVNLFHKVTGTKKTSSTGTASEVQQSQEGQQQAAGAQPTTTPVVQQAGQQPPAVTNPRTLTSYQQALVSGVAPLLQQPVERPKGKKGKQQQVSEKALVAGVGPLLQQLFLRPPEPQNVTQPLIAGSQAPLFPGKAPMPSMLGQRPPGPDNRFNQKRPSRFDIRGPVAGAGLGPGPRFNQNPQNPGSRFNNPYPSNQQARFPGQAAVGYSAPTNLNKPQQQGVQRPQAPTNLNKRKQQGIQRPQGSEPRFNENRGNPASRFDNPKPQKDPNNFAELGEGKYAESEYSFSENDQFPGSWSDNSRSEEKTEPPLSADSETRFNQKPQNPRSRFDNPSKQTRPMIGQGAGSYPGSDSRFNQNAQYPGSWSNKGASLDKTKPAFGADLDPKYYQMQWNSGSQSGSQGFYNEPRPTTGMGAGRYGEQYNQGQWQSQLGGRGAYGSGMDRTPGSDSRFNQAAQYPGSWSDNSASLDKPKSLLGAGTQGPQSMTSTGFMSERQQGTWPSQDPPKAGVLPRSILKNRTGNVS